ncbi:hypothetical protein L596_014978 [Steinernema carpocapsae]|uniref:Uncharacterized protein n=1 Tax=Steinernema carpocapsae TaxID=34508 RepID=A0A4U5NEI9_STECR|nr:hypothetical protein L596_014978 [Steinernema carpocapsae]
MFVSRYLLLFCFFTAPCTNAAKNANERACEMPSLAKTPDLQRNTQTLFTRLANPARHPSLLSTLFLPARYLWNDNTFPNMSRTLYFKNWPQW